MLDQTTDFAPLSDYPPLIAAGNVAAGVKKSAPRRRVLVVDDEALVRWTVTEVLTAACYEVLEAHDGKSAIRTIIEGRGHLDIVMLDLRLPDSCDLRLLEAIVQLVPTAAIVLMTAYGTPELEADALRLGASSVVAKPFDIMDLPPLVAGALSFRRAS